MLGDKDHQFFDITAAAYVSILSGCSYALDIFDAYFSQNQMNSLLTGENMQCNLEHEYFLFQFLEDFSQDFQRVLGFLRSSLRESQAVIRFGTQGKDYESLHMM